MLSVEVSTHLQSAVDSAFCKFSQKLQKHLIYLA